MATENENIKKESEENSGDGTHKHHTWIADSVEKIEEKIEELTEQELGSIDTAFPLSGGEQEHPVVHKTADEIKEDKKNEEEGKAKLKHDLKVNFPLSGGEE